MSGLWGHYGDIPANIPIAAGQFVRRRFDEDETDYNGYEGFDVAERLPFSQSSPSRSLNSNFVPSSTRNIHASYSVEIATTLSLSGGQSGTVFLEISANGSTGWVELARLTNGNTGTLTIGLNTNQTVAASVSGVVPAGYTVRLRTADNTGTPTFTYRSGQEATL